MPNQPTVVFKALSRHLRRTQAYGIFLGFGLVTLLALAGSEVDAIFTGNFELAIPPIIKRYTVAFPETPVLQYQGEVPGLKATAPDGSNKFDATADAVIAYQKYLEQTKSEHILAIETLIGHSLKIHHSYDLTLSGIAADFTLPEIDKITTYLGFTTHVDTYYPLDTFRSPNFIGASALWDSSASSDHRPHLGAGVTIGVLDTGYNRAHPSFGIMPPLCNGDRYGPFLKVKSALDCTRTGCPDAIAGGDVRDYDGHGSHTASIAAGVTLTNTLINTATSMSYAPVPTFPTGFAQMSGVAPCADLRIYRVCDDGSACSDSDVRAGQEAAIRDAVDVINFSIGSGNHPWWTAGDNERGFLDAFNAGIVVVGSAGNVGGSITNPFGQVHHLGPWVLAAAAVSHDHADVLPGRITATGPGTPPANTQNIVLTPSDTPIGIRSRTGITMRSLAENRSGCTRIDGSSAFPPGYFGAAVALLSREDCGLVEQIHNAAAAGASAIVFYSTHLTGPYNIYMSGIVSPIPIYSVVWADANALLNYIDANHGSITMDFTAPRTQGNVLASYSLRGPNSSFDLTKPDLAAPGTQIYAAYITSPDIHETALPNNYAYLSGTSMAAPLVAGAAALVREAHPNWSPAEVMSALRLTAYEGGTEEDGITPWNPDDVGNGRVDLTQATRAGLVMNETYAHFRDADPVSGGDPKTLNLPAVRDSNCATGCRWIRTLHSGLSTSSTWEVTAFDTPNATISVSPMTFMLAPRGSAGDSVELTIIAHPRTTTPVNIGFSEVVLRSSSDPSLPPEHITVAIQYPH